MRQAGCGHFSVIMAVITIEASTMIQDIIQIYDDVSKTTSHEQRFMSKQIQHGVS